MASSDLQPGDRLQYRDGGVVELFCRKRPDDGRSTTPFFPGWWLVDGGGLADFVIDQPESEWRLIDGRVPVGGRECVVCGAVGSCTHIDGSGCG